MDFSLVGSGNLAYSLSKAMIDAGLKPRFLLSRNKRTAADLAKKYSFTIVDNHSRLAHKGFVVIAVNDDQIKNVASKIPNSDAILMHTSGSVAISALGKSRSRIAVFYPLQTFASNKYTSFHDIPVCIEGNHSLVLSAVKKLAVLLKSDVYILNSAQRKHVHLSAVMVNNFSNHLLDLSFDHLQRQNIDREILFPLIKTTFRNALKYDPSKLQTGPAARSDSATIIKHLQMLDHDPALSKIYLAMSDSISAKVFQS